MRRPLTVLSLVVGLVLGLVTAAAAGGPRWDSADQREDVLTVKQATAAYHDVDNAIADGYVGDLEHCVPGMGYHFINPALLDGTIDLTAPEVLVYEPTDDGLELRAVEHLVVSDSAPTAYDGEEFKFFAPNPFGPGDVYALHAWIWGQPNPNGTFADFDPSVTCPPVEGPIEHTE